MQSASEIVSFSYQMGDKSSKDDGSAQSDGSQGDGAQKPGMNRGVSKGVKVKSGSFQRGGGSSGGGGAGGTQGKAALGTVTINKVVDSTSAVWGKCCATGVVLPTVNLAIRKSGGDRLIYLQYCFRACQVKSIKWDGGTGEARPTESFDIEFKAIGMQYYRQTAGGSIISDIESAEVNRDADTKDRMFIFKWNVTEGEGQEDLTVNSVPLSDEEAFLDPFADWTVE
jgi:type VI protein secretion system component Hcp